MFMVNVPSDKVSKSINQTFMFDVLLGPFVLRKGSKVFSECGKEVCLVLLH